MNENAQRVRELVQTLADRYRLATHDGSEIAQILTLLAPRTFEPGQETHRFDLPNGAVLRFFYDERGRLQGERLHGSGRKFTLLMPTVEDRAILLGLPLQLPAPAKPTWGPESEPLNQAEFLKVHPGMVLVCPEKQAYAMPCVASYPSTIGIWTVVLDAGHLPYAFVRPDALHPGDSRAAFLLDRQPGQGGQG